MAAVLVAGRHSQGPYFHFNPVIVRWTHEKRSGQAAAGSAGGVRPARLAPIDSELVSPGPSSESGIDSGPPRWRERPGLRRAGGAAGGPCVDPTFRKAAFARKGRP